jgi:hypothetical protein
MTKAEYQQARSAVIAGGDPSASLLDDCRETVRLLIRTAGLPAFYSPVGVWSEEAVEEVFADWVAVRMIGRGQLLAMLQRSPALQVFRRMAETSVRQHLVDGLKRSQSANLYERVAKLLLDEQKFAGTGSGRGRLWHVTGGPEKPFEGEDQRLLGVAWGLGDFRVIRYDIDAKKLSPLLEAEELERFVTGILRAGAMTTGTIMRAMQMRFSLDDQSLSTEFDPEAHARVGGDPGAEVVVADLVTATLAELTARQARVLVGLVNDVPVRELATQVGCSTGTISHEKAQIADILARLGTDAPKVLNQVVDALLLDEV